MSPSESEEEEEKGEEWVPAKHKGRKTSRKTSKVTGVRAQARPEAPLGSWLLRSCLVCECASVCGHVRVSVSTSV